MRANLKKVITAWLEGAYAIGDSKRTCSTYGGVLWSYHMPIGVIVKQPGSEQGHAYIVQRDDGPTVTTRMQLGALAVHMLNYAGASWSACTFEVSAEDVKRLRYANGSAHPEDAKVQRVATYGGGAKRRPKVGTKRSHPVAGAVAYHDALAEPAAPKPITGTPAIRHSKRKTVSDAPLAE